MKPYNEKYDSMGSDIQKNNKSDGWKPDTLYLIGYRCTGKSTIGRLLATLMGCPFFDTDRMIEEKFNMTINELVVQKGWEYFRLEEKQVLFETRPLFNHVIATGGGIVLDPENRSFIQTHGICAWLYADPDTIINRLLSDAKNYEARPRFSNDSLSRETQKMLKIRTPLYKELGQIQINTSTYSPEQAAIKIKRSITNVRQ